MNLLINSASTYKGGGVQVVQSFIEEFRNWSENEYHVILGEMLSELVDESLFPDNFFFYRIGYRPATRVLSFKSHNRFLKEIENQVQPDVVFTTSGPAYWRPKAPHLAGYNLPHYIYRDSPFFEQIPLWKRVKWDIKGKIIKHFFKNDAEAYVVQTDDVNRRLRSWLNTDQVTTVLNTCSEFYRNPQQFPDKLPEREPGEFRFLTLSAWYPHKNIDIIPSILDLLPDKLKSSIRFVLTIPDETYRKNIPEKYKDQVWNAGPVKSDECPSLYKECDALFLPTLLECFSASYPEAMAMEKPIITTDLGFARSICDDSALYFEAVNPADAKDTIVRLYKSDELQKEMIENGKKRLQVFDTPAERARKYLDICERLASGSL